MPITGTVRNMTTTNSKILDVLTLREDDLQDGFKAQLWERATRILLDDAFPTKAKKLARIKLLWSATHQAQTLSRRRMKSR